MAGSARLEGRNAVIAAELLRCVAEILEGNGVEYWLEGGTLLGIVREQRLLPWDNDLDISVTSEQLPRLLACLRLIKRAGYRVRTRKQEHEDLPLRRGAVRLIKVHDRPGLFRRGEVLLDIFVKYKADEQYWWSVGRKRYCKKSVPARFYESLDRVRFEGKDYLVPADTDGYLTSRYGDWKTPVREWDYAVDDLAIEQPEETPRS